MKPKVLTVVGTRPEAIKMAPVIVALRAIGVDTTVCTTGQHQHLTPAALADLGVTVDRALPPRLRHELEQPVSLGAVVGELTAALSRELMADRPALMLVHGDTASAVAGALAAVYARVPLAHVEAGLRAGTTGAPFPEEVNRRIVDQLATLWFAPTQRAANHLLAEGCAADRVHVTGNTVVDALLQTVDLVRHLPRTAFPGLSAIPATGQIALITAHRRENVGVGLSAIVDVARGLALDGVSVVWPLHPNPDVGPIVHRALDGVAGITLLPPLPYPAFLRLLLDASLVLTDSGGVLEEAACLGRPTLVLRADTERPEVAETGVVRVVGTEPATVLSAARQMLAQPPAVDLQARPLGDGQAAPRIAAVVAAFLAKIP